MWLEILLASVLAFVVYWFVSWDKNETLPLEDGWWGPGARPAAPEDESIRPFKVETSDEEIRVRCLLQAGLGRGEGGGPSVFPVRPGVGFPPLCSHRLGAGCCRETCPACLVPTPPPLTPHPTLSPLSPRPQPVPSVPHPHPVPLSPPCPLCPPHSSVPPSPAQSPVAPGLEGGASWPWVCAS